MGLGPGTVVLNERCVEACAFLHAVAGHLPHSPVTAETSGPALLYREV